LNVHTRGRGRDSSPQSKTRFILVVPAQLTDVTRVAHRRRRSPGRGNELKAMESIFPEAMRGPARASAPHPGQKAR
jgi:hypothetical protein